MTVKGNRQILALVSDAFGGHGGIAQYNRDFLAALAVNPEVAEIDVLPRHAPEAFTPPRNVFQARPGGNRLAYALRALKMALDRRTDVIFCGHINLAPLAALTARICGARLIIQLHGIEGWAKPGAWYRAAIESADVILCVSRYTRARLLQWAAMEPERAIVLPNTVNPVFAPGDASPLRAAWGLQGKSVLLTVARMDSRERYKGHERVMKALAAMDDNIVYVVLGGGDDVDHIKSLATRFGVADRVHFKGVAGLETLAEAYRMADLYVMPSTGEGFGIAFLEAMASGLPALGLACAGATDALADGELGTAVPDAEFSGALGCALRQPRPDPVCLSKAVRLRFGPEPFAAGVCSVLANLFEPA